MHKVFLLRRVRHITVGKVEATEKLIMSNLYYSATLLKQLKYFNNPNHLYCEVSLINVKGLWQKQEWCLFRNSLIYAFNEGEDTRGGFSIYFCVLATWMETSGTIFSPAHKHSCTHGKDLEYWSPALYSFLPLSCLPLAHLTLCTKIYFLNEVVERIMPFLTVLSVRLQQFLNTNY